MKSNWLQINQTNKQQSLIDFNNFNTLLNNSYFLTSLDFISREERDANCCKMKFYVYPCIYNFTPYHWYVFFFILNLFKYTNNYCTSTSRNGGPWHGSRHPLHTNNNDKWGPWHLNSPNDTSKASFGLQYVFFFY